MDWMSLLTECISYGVPLLCFVIISWYANKSKNVLSEKKIADIQEYLINYFSLCNDPIMYTFQESREYIVTIESNTLDVQDLDDIDVYINGIDMGTFYEYMYNGKHFYETIYENLSKKSISIYKQKKKDTIYKRLDHYLDTIKEEDIHANLFQLNKNILYHLQEHTLDERMEKKYLPILCDILETYERLESSDQLKDMTYTKRCLDILETLNHTIL